MLTRRRFLAYSGTALLAATAGCRPPKVDMKTLSDWDTQRNDFTLAEKTKIRQWKSRFLGYPLNMNRPPPEFFQWRERLNQAGVGQYAFNNVGSPFAKSPILFNTHDLEQELILRFARIYGFNANDVWGFLSHSGTDSNMHGMYMGRTLLTAQTGTQPKVYFTQEAHYSIQILRDLLGLETVFVDTLPDGSMDPEHLALKLAESPDRPALVVATIGTTFKGAIDQVDRIQQELAAYPSYLHLDAALFGGYLPYTEHADEVLYKMKTEGDKGRYDSIAVSCHKFFGFPSPAGLFITTRQNFDRFNEQFKRIHNPAYIHQVPGTITCSRDAVKPAEFYFFSEPSALVKQAEDSAAILHHSGYLYAQMQRHLPHYQVQRSNAVSNTLYFKMPSQAIIDKYSLATMQLHQTGGIQNYAHAVIMPHITKSVLDEFLDDLGRANI